MPRPYDQVEFKSWSKSMKDFETVCTATLVKGKLHYTGKEAEDIKQMVDENPHLEEYRAIGGYTLLAQLTYAYAGSYFYATDVQEASLI